MISSGFLVCLISIYFMMVGNGTTLYAKARELLPEHQTYRQQQQRERGHSWDDMSL